MVPVAVEPILFRVPSGEIKASILGDKNSANRLAVVLPGAGYSCKQPLLYFGVQVLLKSGYRVLTVDSLYAENKNWRDLPSEEAALKCVEDDSSAMFTQIQSQFSVGVHTVFARSLGTYSLAFALEKELIHPVQIIWQCPSLQGKWEILRNDRARNLIIVGTADPRYEFIAPFLSRDSFVAKDADHAMEVCDPIRSIELLKQISEFTQHWINESDVDLSQIERNLELTPERRLHEHQAALELCDVLARAGQRIHEQSQ